MRSRSVIQIPRQRGRGRRRHPAAQVIDFGRGTAPVVVMAPYRQPLGWQLATAAALGLWRTRAACAPTWAALGLYGSTTLLGAVVPLAWAPLGGLAVALPAGWLLARRRVRLAVHKRRLYELRTPAACLAGVLAWMAAAIGLGAAFAPVAVVWLAGTGSAQALWWRHRRTTRALAAVPVAADPAGQVPADEIPSDQPVQH